MRVGKKPTAFLSSIVALWFTYTAIVDYYMRLFRLNNAEVLAAILFEWIEWKKFHRGVERTFVVLATTAVYSLLAI